eukprot:356731-Chlamydomonas_euryale.AAC.2
MVKLLLTWAEAAQSSADAFSDEQLLVENYTASATEFCTMRSLSRHLRQRLWEPREGSSHREPGGIVDRAARGWPHAAFAVVILEVIASKF